MNLTDSRLAQGGCEKLDLALLSFFEQFRKIYVGDQVQKTSKVRAESDQKLTRVNFRHLSHRIEIFLKCL